MKGLEGRHVSLDIEACGEVVLSIGACEFNPDTGGIIGQPFHRAIDPQQQMDHGLKMDGQAFHWWLKQSAEARAAIYSNPADPEAAIVELRAWWPDREAWTWAYPTSFDLPLIARLCAAFSKRPPWKWTRTLDGRTLWVLACARDPECARIEKSEAASSGAHRADNDAVEQAGWFVRYLKAVSDDER